MSTTHTDTTGFAGGQVVAFDLGGEEYALPIDQVREVIRFAQPRRVSDDPRLLGVINLRGKLVPVTDLAAHLGLPPVHNEDAKIVVVETGDQTSAGIVVDDVKEVLTVDSRHIEPLPAGGTGAIDAIAKLDDRLVMVLDTRGIL